MSRPDRRDREGAVAQTLVTIADTLVREFDVHDLFDRLTTACVTLLTAAAAGLMLAEPDGRLQLMASSSEVMRALELFEVQPAEGPCRDCYASSEPVAVDLRDSPAARSWLLFTAEARANSITWVQALPMRLRGETIGVLTLFHTADQRPDDHDTALAQALADVATIAILHRRALSHSELLSEQLQAALTGRVVIEQAKGLLAERGALSVDAAFTVLRDYCRATRLPLTATAAELLSGARDPDEVLALRPEHSPR